MFKHPPAYLATVCQALFVTFLWLLSWVLIKIGLHDVPALTFAGLRDTLAFSACFHCFSNSREKKSEGLEGEYD